MKLVRQDCLIVIDSPENLGVNFKRNSFVQRFLKQIEVVQKVILDNPFSLFYNIPVTRYGPLAQLAEQLTLNQWVRGSSPRWITMWALSSAGRASALQAECQRFDPVSAHHFFICGPVVQLVRMPPCHGGGHEFESRPGRHDASVAQLVEQGTENPCVHSSILC